MRIRFGLAPVVFTVLFLASQIVTSAEAAETTVICKDGTSSKGGKGACSGHGGVDKSAGKAGAKTGAAGVAEWLDKSAK
jgi:hypothetical protein